MKRIALLIGVLSLGGCAPSQVRVAPVPVAEVSASTCAAALAEAFDVYEREVDTASTLTFGSEAEAYAVMQTLSEARFDWLLTQALARRGLTMADLARYAEANQAFLQEQQHSYAGRFARLQGTVATFAQHVRVLDGHLLASD
jgi:hypothetical protein